MDYYKTIEGIEIPVKAREFTSEDVLNLKHYLLNNEDLDEVCERIGWANCLRIMSNKLYDESIHYFQVKAKELTYNREKITLKAFFKRIFGQRCRYKQIHLPDDIISYYKAIIEIINDEY